MSIIEDDIFLELMNGYSRLVVKTNTQMVKIFKTKQKKTKKNIPTIFSIKDRYLFGQDLETCWGVKK